MPKKCCRCEAEKETDCFYKDKSRPDGLSYRCKQCHSTDASKRRNQNRQEYNAKERQRRQNNLERYRELDRLRYKENPRVREQNEQWKSENKDKHILSIRNWQRNNPDKVKAANHRRRARVRKARGNFTAEQWEARLNYYGNKCVYCGTSENITIEHRIPLSRGGTNWSSNLVPACSTCNCKKSSKTETEYLEVLYSGS